ncbi:hypothetical protein CFP56_024283 [Quercus suber]|uniref:Uncharacterized protein n=1 Tax=Quercus suber TaxID=58331 RepID=A0AAW0MBG1_QUESU
MRASFLQVNLKAFAPSRLSRNLSCIVFLRQFILGFTKKVTCLCKGEMSKREMCCSAAVTVLHLMHFLPFTSSAINLLIASQLKKELAWANQMKAVKAGVI